MKNNKGKNKPPAPTALEVLNLDPETRAKLQTVSNELDRTPSEVVGGLVRSIDSLFS